jgi:hypothetical protein
MEKATNGQFRELIGKFLVKGSDEKVALINKKKIQTAINSLSSEDNTVIDNFIHFINNSCRLNVVMGDNFIVGDVFRHRGGEGYIHMYLGDNAQNGLFKPAKDRIIAINPIIGKLCEYVLPENMNDTVIQKNAKSSPMSEDQFLLILYLLLIKPDLGKKILNYVLDKNKIYIFHVKLNSGTVVAVDVRWRGGEWYVRADDFDYDFPWGAGRVFLSLATV